MTSRAASILAWVIVVAVGFGLCAGLSVWRYPGWTCLRDAMKSLAWITGAVQAVSLGAITQVTQAIPGEDQLESAMFRSLMESIERARTIVFRAWSWGASAGLLLIGFAAVPDAAVDGKKYAWIFMGAFGALTTVAICALFRVGVVIFRLVELRNDLRLEAIESARQRRALEDIEKTKEAVAKANKEEALAGRSTTDSAGRPEEETEGH